jgi:hypothetical protein
MKGRAIHAPPTNSKTSMPFLAIWRFGCGNTNPKTLYRTFHPTFKAIKTISAPHNKIGSNIASVMAAAIPAADHINRKPTLPSARAAPIEIVTPRVPCPA